MQNCKCSFDSAPLHRSTNLFPNSKSPSPTLPISLDPDFVFLSTFPFPQQFKKSLSPPPEHSWRDEDKEAFQDCTLGLPYFIFSTGKQEKLAAFLYERGNSS
ncbi:hypothetical protein NC652_007035 [Populus alba x Populus x berolinensis]|nr:hypothetical protein NC652_007035 [Populus alba x Populus x berolinensis]